MVGFNFFVDLRATFVELRATFVELRDKEASTSTNNDSLLLPRERLLLFANLPKEQRFFIRVKKFPRFADHLFMKG